MKVYVRRFAPSMKSEMGGLRCTQNDKAKGYIL